MTKRSSAPARALAVAALIGGFVVFFVVLSAAMEGGDTDETGGRSQERIEREEKRRDAPATYVVENGDTLTAIARETGVPVPQILRLNPDVDPQILIAGEELKLR